MERAVVIIMAYVEKYMQFCAHACGCPSFCKARMRAAKKRIASMGVNSTVVQASLAARWTASGMGTELHVLCNLFHDDDNSPFHCGPIGIGRIHEDRSSH